MGKPDEHRCCPDHDQRRSRYYSDADTTTDSQSRSFSDADARTDPLANTDTVLRIL